MEQNSHYKLGTIYTHTDGRTGIVVDVDEDNQPTLLLALWNTLGEKTNSEGKKVGPTWYDAVGDFENPNNPNGDLYNDELNVEQGFHLPSEEELMRMKKNWPQIQHMLEKLASEGKCDGLKTEDGEYFTHLWSSTPQDRSYAYCFHTKVESLVNNINELFDFDYYFDADDLEVDSFDKECNSYHYRVRGVAVL